MPKLKVLLVDNPQYKTTLPLIEYLTGREDVELKLDAYFDPEKAAWADVIWVEWIEYSAILASHRVYNDENCRLWNDAENRFGPGGSRDWSRAKLILRGIDIDILYGHFRGVKWENVDELLFIAEHIKNIVVAEEAVKDRLPPITVVPLGIDMRTMTFREREPQGNRQVAIVHHCWSGKNLSLLAQALAALVRKTDRNWNFQIVGTWSNEAWLPRYFWHILTELGIRDLVLWNAAVPDMNKFLDAYDYSVSASSKEAFSLTTAEAAAKGLKPLIHVFEGARDIWPDEFLWLTIDEFVEKMMKPIESVKYREIASKYDTAVLIPKLAEVIYGAKRPVRQS